MLITLSTTLLVAKPTQQAVFQPSAIADQESRQECIIQALQAIIEAKSAALANPTMQEIELSQADRDIFISKAAAAAGAITTFVILHRIINMPKNFSGFLKASCKLVIGGAFGTWIFGDFLYGPIINFLVTVSCGIPQQQNPETVHGLALTEFIKSWPQLRKNAPQALFPKIDALYLHYINNACTLNVSSHDASKIINTIIMQCMYERLETLESN